jgi:cell division protease FtsH
MNVDNYEEEKINERFSRKNNSFQKETPQNEEERHLRWRSSLLHYIQNMLRWTKRTLNSKKRILTTLTFVITVLSTYYYRSRQRRRRLTRQVDATSLLVVPISVLWKALHENQLTKVLLGSQSIRFQSSAAGGTQWNQVQLPPQHSILQKELITRLTSMKDLDLSILPETDWNTVTTLLFAAVPFFYLAFVYRLMTKMQQTPPTENETDTSMLFHPSASQPPVTFADVAGLDAAVADLRDLARLLLVPECRGTARMPRGILLQGPPGTGKTLLARALAHEWPGPFYHMAASSFVEVYVGRGAARVRALFRQARGAEPRGIGRVWQKYWRATAVSSEKVASSRACAIVFIDELDALAKTRSTTALGGNDEREQTLNQLLTEMDGFSSEGRPVIVLGATNRPDVLDPAMVRRFDRTIAVGLPDAAGRAAMLQLHARHLPLDPTIDWTRLAERTARRSGSDVRHIVNDAALYAGRAAQPYVVTQRDLEAAIQRRRPSRPPCLGET